MADITIDPSVGNFDYRHMRIGPFWTTPLIGYLIYSDAAMDIVYQKTIDGGATWGGKVAIDAGAVGYHVDCWADWQTPGDTGTKIHIAYVDNGVAKAIRYIYLDTSDDSVGGADDIEGFDVQGNGDLYATAGYQWHQVSITKTVGGNLAVAFRFRDAPDDYNYYYGFYTSPDGDTWTSRAAVFEPASNQRDFLQLYPANLADPDDLWALYEDGSANDLMLKTFDDSGNSWSEATIDADHWENSDYPLYDGQIRTSDGHLIAVAWSEFDAATADLRSWDITDAGTITAKANLETDQAEGYLVSVFINQINDDIYVVYADGTAAEDLVKVYYQKSDDGMGSWGGLQAMQANAEDDMRWVGAGAMASALGGKFLPCWFNMDLSDVYCNTDNSISFIAVWAGGDVLGVDKATIAKISGVAKANIVNVSGVE